MAYTTNMTDAQRAFLIILMSFTMLVSLIWYVVAAADQHRKLAWVCLIVLVNATIINYLLLGVK